jgi:hypothetical protein
MPIRNICCSAWDSSPRGASSSSRRTPSYGRPQLLGERVLGPENEWTLRALLFQADLSEAQLHDDQAAALYQQALSDYEQALDPSICGWRRP